MKTNFKLICASLIAVMLASSCKKEAEQITFSSDPAALNEVPCMDPADQVLTLTTNANWIVVTPTWVKADPVFGSGTTIVSFKVGSTYINEKTDVASRTGEIVFSGGGKSYVVPITQLGYTAPVDPSASIGGIPDVDEFMKFVQAVNENEGISRWLNANKEVELLSDIDLSEYQEWTPIGAVESVTNGNYAGGYNGVAFKGVFNGGGHTIRGFKPTVTVAADGTFGLFGALDGATIKDLNINTDLVISATAQADAGVLAGTAISSTIQNVTVSGKITSAGNGADNKRFALGGIAGFVFNTGTGTSLIKDCTVNLTVNADCGSNTKNGAGAAMYGGIAGFVTTSQDNSANDIQNCVNNGEITAKLGRCSGIVATANYGGHFLNCTNNANQVNSFTDGRVGNVVSVLYKNAVADGLVNNGNLTTSDVKTHAGAIVGFFNDDAIVMKGGKNTGTIIAANTTQRGLIGANISKFASITDVTVGGKLGTYKADGNHEMIDVNAGNFEDYIGSISAANRAKVSGLTWDGAPAPVIEGIATAADLKEFATLVNSGGDVTKFMVDGAIVLGTDIDLSEYQEWTPIGAPETVTNGNYESTYTGVAFKGVFNGGGHTIKGFKPTVKVADKGTFGLFGVLDGATIKDLNIETDLTISAAAQADAGVLAGTSISSTIQNVKVSGKITSAGTETNSKRFALGGIAGFVFNTGTGTSLIKDCTVDLTVSADGGKNTANGATAAMYAGIACFVTTSQDESANDIQNCVNSGEITAKLGRCSGIVATANYGGHFKDCTNNANQVNTIANGRIGNVVSVLYKNAVAEGLVNNGNLTTSASDTHAGAIVGFFNDDAIVMTGGQNTGTIIAANTNQRGLIGANISKFKSISGVTVGGKLGTYKEDGNHEMIDVNSSNFEQYIGAISDANRAKVSGLVWGGGSAPSSAKDGKFVLRENVFGNE